LKDGHGTVALDQTGVVTGLDAVSTSTRDQIAKALVSEKIDRPEILRELTGPDSTLRGSNSGQAFRLISPARTVFVSDRPAFKWDRVSGASSYRVYVTDPTGHITARSEELPSERREWVVAQSLKRGEIYAWSVVAIVDGKEMVSPGPSSPEMKFQILSIKKLPELNRLKKTRSHLALGVFYAREGMTAEAEREFQILVQGNPRSKIAEKLLKEIQSWQRR